MKTILTVFQSRKPSAFSSLLNAFNSTKSYLHVLTSCWLLLMVSSAAAQNMQIKGTVLDTKNQPIVGASVAIKGTTLGTITDVDGVFDFITQKQENLILVISAIGQVKKEIQFNQNANANQTLSVQLEPFVQELDELIVTGVFDSRKRIESSIAITTLDSKVIDRIVPNSAAELLRQVPGVFVNTSRGEIYNDVATRGMVLGGAYYYVSMQEDGLPIIPTAGQYNPDGFLRADITTGRLEAVRGGNASVLGVNAPGGIFNYITKTGTSQFEGEFRTRFGLEGNGKNPYYRAEASFSGPLLKSDSTLTYFIGGHYRQADGAKYPGYPLSRGGQIKANLKKSYANGSFQFNLKYLNDRTVQFEYTPTVNFDNPTPAGGFTNSSSVLNPIVAVNYPASILGLAAISYDSRNLNNYIDFSPGFNWEHRLGNGWKIQNTFRYSEKSLLSNSSFIVYPFAVDNFLFYAVNGLLGKAGTYNFYNTKTKQNYGSVTQSFDFSNPDFPFKFTNNLKLPGGEVQANSVFYNPISYEKGNMKDIVNQFTVKKQFEKMSFTAGIFHSTSNFDYFLTPPAASGFGTIEDKPQFVGIDYIPSGVKNAPTYHFTDPNGVADYGNGGLYNKNATVKQTAFFFGHNWDINEHINLDWGFRVENFRLKAYRQSPLGLKTSLGGVDGDSTTLYDNNTFQLSEPVNYEAQLSNYGFSGGINYKIHSGLSFYGRYSQGSKSPEFNFYDETSSIYSVEPEKTIQIELGIKMVSGRNNLFITPFYSALDKVPLYQRGQNAGLPATFYPTPKLYNKTHTIGIELEGNYAFNKNWSVRASAVVQQFTADRYQYWDTRDVGPADDTLIDRSGKKISSSSPPLIFNLTPTFTKDKFFANINWYYMGERAANSSETFYLPAFSQFDLNMGYAFSKKILLQASVNNLLNTFGIMNWTAPTPSGLPFDTFDTDLFSPEKRAANPKAVYFTSAIQPRSFFVSCSFKL